MASLIVRDDRRQMTSIDMETVLRILLKTLRGNQRPNERPRGELEASCPAGQINGDLPNIDDETLAAILKKFDSQPKQQRQALLNGWSPRVLDINRAEFVQLAQDNILAPCLRLDSDADSGEFDVMPESTGAPVSVFITAGTTKAEALAAIEALRYKIDCHWPELISESMNHYADEPTQVEAAKIALRVERQDAN